jgi:hypothetical protein
VCIHLRHVWHLLLCSFLNFMVNVAITVSLYELCKQTDENINLIWFMPCCKVHRSIMTPSLSNNMCLWLHQFVLNMFPSIRPSLYSYYATKPRTRQVGIDSRVATLTSKISLWLWSCGLRHRVVFQVVTKFGRNIINSLQHHRVTRRKTTVDIPLW